MLERDTARPDKGLVDWGKTDKTRHGHAVLYVEHVHWRRLLRSFGFYAGACFLIQLAVFLVLMWTLIEMIAALPKPDRILSELLLSFAFYTQRHSPWQLLSFCARFAVYGTVVFVVVSVLTHTINRSRAEIDSYARLVTKSWPLMLVLMPGALLMFANFDDNGTLLETGSVILFRIAGSAFAYRYFACVRQSYNVGIARGMMTVGIIMVGYFAVTFGLYLLTAF